MIVLDPDYAEADIGLAFANAGLERRESDQVVIIKAWGCRNPNIDKGPYPFAQVVDFGR